MFHIEPSNKYIADYVEARIRKEKPDSRSMVISEFCGASYHLSTSSSDESFKVSLKLACFEKLEKYGVKEVLESKFPGLVVSPEQNYSVTIQVTKDEARVDILRNELPQLHRHALASLFYYVQKNGKGPCELRYRENEFLYVSAEKERLSATLSTQFKDEADRVFAKLFLQEFADARKQGVGPNAPGVVVSQTAPNGISGPDGVYVTFNLSGANLTGQTFEQSISRILGFRDYLHYHIKCAKAYMHSRMRGRADGFLKILNRARIEGDKERKTASGRTFIRK